MKIGVIEGSIREGRKGASVAQWVMDEAARRDDDTEFELIVLADFNVPLLTSPTVPAAADRHYDSPEVTAWSKAIDDCDGFIFVTAEYNHSIPGALKNAIDSIGPEFQNKAAAVVSYGADGGVRAVEHMRQVLANFNMFVIRTQISLSLFAEFGEDGVAPNERRSGEISGLFDSLVEATRERQT